MKSFNKLYGLGLLSLFLCFAACTSETVEPTPTPAPEPSGQAERRNVLLTLQNKLSVAKTNNDTKAETIATADENKISSLDIYVFGSKTEDGTYTYQERFCYREKSSDLPTGSDVTAIDLNAVGDKGTETTALLSLQKGLFVKLYCIANQSKLIDPAYKNEFNNFVPLVQSNPGQAGNNVTDGIPVEADFKLLQSIQLDPASATDLLLTPLPMTGAYTTPLDLTDFSVSARLQLGFRLTRSVARFDIVNDAKTSKFTIQSVSMANGRKGVSFFPLTVTGTKPATAGDLITYPARKFDGEKANEGTCTGAFYTWPSPLEDAGYLILTGTYAANATENIPVTYQVPFKPAGEGNYIEVAHNHRYTVAITAADEYHLDFTINVADWTDEGNIDEYEPGGDADENGVTVDTNAAGIKYDKDLRTITVSLNEVSNFEITGNSAGGYYVSKYYLDNDKAHDWLKMEGPSGEIATKTDDGKSIYTFSLNENYQGSDYPLAFIRFTDRISAKESVIMIQAISDPVVKDVINPSPGASYSEKVLTFKPTTDIQKFSIDLKVFSAIGSRIEKQPDWLSVSPTTIAEAEGCYTFHVEALPDPYKEKGDLGFDIINLSDETKKENITVKVNIDEPNVKSATRTSPAGSGSLSYYDISNKKMYLFDDDSEVKLTVFSLGGCNVINVPSWITVTPGETKNTMELTFKQETVPTLEDISGTIQIQNILDTSKTLSITVYNKTSKIRLQDFKGSNQYSKIEESSSITAITPNVIYYPTQKNYFEFKVRTPFGISSISDQVQWINKPSMQNQVLPNGDYLTTIKVTMKNNITPELCNTRRKTGSIIITSQKLNETKRMNIKTEHITFNDPNATIPPIYVSTAYEKYWLSPSVATVTAGEYNSYKNRCPSGWELISSENITYLFTGKKEAHPGKAFYGSFKNIEEKNYVINLQLSYTAISGGPGWFFYPKENDLRYSLGVASGSNGIDLRCWRKYNSNDN